MLKQKGSALLLLTLMVLSFQLGFAQFISFKEVPVECTQSQEETESTSSSSEEQLGYVRFHIRLFLIEKYVSISFPAYQLLRPQIYTQIFLRPPSYSSIV